MRLWEILFLLPSFRRKLNGAENWIINYENETQTLKHRRHFEQETVIKTNISMSDKVSHKVAHLEQSLNFSFFLMGSSTFFSTQHLDYTCYRVTLKARAERGWVGKRAVRSCWMCDAGEGSGYRGALILRMNQFKSEVDHFFVFNTKFLFFFMVPQNLRLSKVTR